MDELSARCIGRSATTCAASVSPAAPAARSRTPEDLVGLMESLALAPAALVGVSLGGAVALDVTVARPELVSALVLVGSGLRGHEFSAETQAGWAEEEEAFERGDLDAAVEVESPYVGRRPASLSGGGRPGPAPPGGRDAAPGVRARAGGGGRAYSRRARARLPGAAGRDRRADVDHRRRARPAGDARDRRSARERDPECAARDDRRDRARSEHGAPARVRRARPGFPRGGRQ